MKTKVFRIKKDNPLFALGVRKIIISHEREKPAWTIGPVYLLNSKTGRLRKKK